MDTLFFQPLTNRYLAKNVDTKSCMDPRVYFLIVPLAFDRYLSRNINTKYINKYLRRNIDTKSSMDLRVCFFYFNKLLI